MNSLFFQYGANSIIGVSPECCRQVKKLTNSKSVPLYQIRAQYEESYFLTIEKTPSYDKSPFQILFVGPESPSKK